MTAIELKHKVTFVCPDRLRWPEIASGELSRIDGAALSRYSGGILNNWILRTYYHLRMAGADVRVAPVVDPGTINVVSIYDFSRRARHPGAFVVTVQADGHRSRLANFLIEQNFLNPPARNRGAVFHWPQPGLIARDTARGGKVHTLTFKGHSNNLDPAFTAPDFLAALERMDVRFDIDAHLADYGSGKPGGHRWNDYAECDLLLAVRNMTVADARGKPASKLINAWRAGVPALLGPEPAFAELRRSPLDYIEIHSAQDALEAIARLKGDAELYRKMVANGHERAAEFTEERILSDWAALLNGPVAEAFERWQRRPRLARHLSALPGFFLEPLAKARHSRRVHTGERILSS